MIRKFLTIREWKDSSGEPLWEPEMFDEADDAIQDVIDRKKEHPNDEISLWEMRKLN